MSPMGVEVCRIPVTPVGMEVCGVLLTPVGVKICGVPSHVPLGVTCVIGTPTAL